MKIRRSITSMFWVTRLFASASLLIMGSAVNGQSINMTTGTVNVCGGVLYDSGGAGANYGNNQADTLIICGNGNGLPVLDFTSFNLGPGDQLEVYQDTGNFTGTNLIGTFDNTITNPGLIQTNPNLSLSGCLTLIFTSDNTLTGPGWSANLSCYWPCQLVQSGIDSFSVDTVPGGFIDVCQGDTVTFYGTAFFPQNDSFYHQSIGASTFEWLVNQDSSLYFTGQAVDIPFDTAAGYIVSLTVTDSNGCISTNLIEVPVRVSTDPVFAGTGPLQDTICFGETNTLVGEVTPVTWSNQNPTVIAGTTFLPDGSGVSYTSTLTFNNFANGAALTNISDLIDVWLNMEHSYLGDLEIEIACPNGNSTILKQYPGGGGTFLGEACDDGTLTPGIGYTYSFPTAPPTYGTMVATIPFAVGIIDPCTGLNRNTLPAGSYTSFQPLTNLLGCPLNGTWTVTITDNLFIDNGYIFSWGLNFNPALFPSNILTYTPGTDSVYWDTNAIATTLSTNTGGDTILVQPHVFDTTYEYTFTALDSFGCSYDTTVSFWVRSPCDAQCLPNITPVMGSFIAACPGDSSGYAWVAPIDTISPAPYSMYWTDATGDTVRIATGLPGPDTLFNVPGGQYTVTVIDSFGCEISNSTTVAEVPEMQVQVSGIVPTSCAGNFCDGNATISVLSGGTAPFTYLWLGGDTAQTATTLCSDSNTVVITDSRGCVVSDSLIVPSPDSIEITAFGEDTICISNIAPIGANATGGNAPYTFVWNASLPNGATQNVSPGSTRTYQVYATDTNNCPADTDFVTIYVRQPLRTSMRSADTICPYDSIDLEVFPGGGDGNYLYQWQGGLGTGSVIRVSPDVSQFYRVTVSDVCGSSPSAVDSVFVQVGGYRPLQVSVTPDDTVCAGEPIVITAAAVGGDERFTYVWDQGLDTGQFHAFAPLTTKTYWVTVTDECLTPAGSSSVTIYVGDFRDFTATVDKREDCSPGQFFFSLDSNLAGFNYFWDFGDGYRRFTQWDSIERVFDEVGCHDVRVMIRTELGCTTEKFYPCMVEVKRNPLVEFSYSPHYPTQLEPYVNFRNETSYGNRFDWYLSNELYTQQRSFTYEFPGEGQYPVKLVAYNDDGCVDSLQQLVTVGFEPVIWFPTAFTPNGDDLNEQFKPKGEGLLPGGYYALQIYDRWGNLVFTSQVPDIGWDGKYKDGTEAMIGTYAYDITYTIRTGRAVRERGQVQLIR